MLKSMLSILLRNSLLVEKNGALIVGTWILALLQFRQYGEERALYRKATIITAPTKAPTPSACRKLEASPNSNEQTPPIPASSLLIAAINMDVSFILLYRQEKIFARAGLAILLARHWRNGSDRPAYKSCL